MPVPGHRRGWRCRVEGWFQVRWGPGPRRTQGVEGEGYIRKLHRGPQAPKTKITELGLGKGADKRVSHSVQLGVSLSGPPARGLSKWVGWG